MWEFLIKINPSLIRYSKKYDEEFDDLMELALDKGYIPSFSDLKRNSNILFYIEQDSELMKKILEKEPKCLTLLYNVSEEIVEFALSVGYKPKTKDVKGSNLSSSDLIMKLLIKDNPKNIEYYEGGNKRLIDEALRAGWVPSKKAVLKNEYLAMVDTIMYKLIDKDPENILLYNGNNDKLVKYAMQKGFVPNLNHIIQGGVLSYNSELMIKFIRENPRNIIYYNGRDESVFQEALKLGYVPNIDEIKNTNLVSSTAMMKSLVIKDPRNIIYYEGESVSLIKEAIELGFRPKREDFEQNYDLFVHDAVVMALIQKDPRYATFCTSKNSHLVLEAIKLGYKPTIEDVKENYNLRKSDVIFQYLIKVSPKNIVYYTGKNQELVEEAIKLGYVPSLEDVKKVRCLAANDGIMKKIIEKKPNEIIYYKGNNQEIFNLALHNGYVPTESEIYNDEYYNLRSSDQIMKIMIAKDLKYVKLYCGENQDVINFAVEKGFIPKKTDLKANHLLARNTTITEMLLKDDIKNLNFYKVLGDDAISQALHIFEGLYAVNIPDHYVEIFKVYKADLSRFCLNYERFSNFLSTSGIEEELFYQYAFAKSYNWLDDMIRITANGKIDEFRSVKDYFFDNFYSKNGNQSGALKVNSFLNILKNYTNFPELCKDIVNQNRTLTQEEMMNINMIFTLSNLFDKENRPITVSDLNSVTLTIKQVYRDKLNQSINGGVDVMKDTLCQLLFNADQVELRERLMIFGDTKDLRQLLFNNRNHPEMESYIRKMMIYTSIIEDVLNVNDSKVLKEIIDRVLDNFESVVTLSTQFGSYEEKMRYLYEMDIQKNLTMFDNISNHESVIDKEKTTKYGVEVLDFSNKKYCLLAHVMSRRETPEELVNGIAEKNKNFICLSSISNRNQVYYTNPGQDKIIFATDILPEGLFLQSSVTNMGSNGYLAQNGGEVEEMVRVQRGILETSHAPKGNNSEILTYRSGLKFGYIVLPGGREPTEQEIILAKEQGLKFVLTQDVRETIQDPADIEMKKDEVKVYDEKKEFESTISQNSKQLFQDNNEKKSIAILTDAHGLFEPTLAVLEDARRRGITEIYSLGDNIGTGPNPSEVMDLLEEYGVISLLGNHELYVSLGVESFRSHLDKASAYAYDEAKRNSTWTANQLNDGQKQRLRLCAKMQEITLGGKKILLCHDINDFNTGEVVVDSTTYDEVFRGHIHYEGREVNVTTIPGVGIGSNVGQATYMLLTEKDGGGYTREVVTIGYDWANMKHAIIESSMSDEEKSKIEKWAGVSDGTKRR